MTIHRRYLGWGVFLICLGIVPLSVQLGWIDAKTAASVLRLWPLILIGIGLSLVLRMTRYRVIASAVSAAVLGLVLGVFFAGGLASPAFVCTGNQPTAAPVTQTGAFSGSAASINIELSCGDINLVRGSDPGWSVGVATDGAYPIVRADTNALDLRSATSRLVGPFPGVTDEHWQITLPSSTDLTAGVILNAASGRLSFGNGVVDHVSATFNGSDSTIDLGGATGAGSLDATLNASSVRLVLPEAPVTVGITLNVASLNVCVPPSSALHIQYSSTLGSDNFRAAGLQGSGENWSTPGELSNATELHVTSNVSSVNIDRSGECQ